MNLTLKVWRQSGPNDKGSFEIYQAKNIVPDMSFLEMLDVVNDELMANGKEPISFDHDCREGICGNQRPSTWTKPWGYNLPIAHAFFPRW